MKTKKKKRIPLVTQKLAKAKRKNVEMQIEKKGYM